ncbi:uncharacterized protein CC84DRAFT_1258141 [Paraphaeosphaeria sporulosa]|uniref:Uncharacterized protein n=1 Tax=Paraphaeosphaeria sporulosa TaxID=1460663 RepID=A0A177CIV1_9PLEO|nr:uncharacterized protein CC84DRAFT_1258141 [Paraphaeosphaeria sporulosa]OAG06902.1 hypothetical protein CC84DRAFT_1258141 [Paraphaeosphaeria sporulosa]
MIGPASEGTNAGPILHRQSRFPLSLGAHLTVPPPFPIIPPHQFPSEPWKRNMSGAGENRSSWQRPQGRGNRASSSNNPSKEGARQQAMSAVSGNAWKAKGQGQGGAERAPAPAPSVPAEQHVPVKDFNAGEVKEFLKKKYLESVAGISSSSSASTPATGTNAKPLDQPSAYHKVQGDSVAKRSSGAWGSRGNMPHLMPSGQDFFTQLKKQLVALDQGKSS